MRDAHGAGDALRGAPRGARPPDHDRRHVVRRAVAADAKTALGTAAKRAAISTTTGDGGMCREEREAVDTMVYQVLPSRYGFNPDHMKMAQAIEIVVGQGAKPGTGGVLLGAKVSEEIANQRTLPVGVDQRSPGPASRLHRARRPAAQDRGAPRGHRLAGAGLREDGRLAASPTT